jgi:hypothetical protein
MRPLSRSLGRNLIAWQESESRWIITDVTIRPRIDGKPGALGTGGSGHGAPAKPRQSYVKVRGGLRSGFSVGFRRFAGTPNWGRSSRSMCGGWC